MMLRWEEFGPLNACHVVELVSTWSGEEVKAAIAATVSRDCPRPIVISPDRCRFRFVEPSRQDSGSIPSDPRDVSREGESVHGVVERQLNTPFKAGEHRPFRFNWVETDGPRSFLIVTYRHALSDSRGVSALIRRILRQLRGASQLPRLSSYAPPINALFPDNFCMRARLSAALSTSREIAQGVTCLHPQVKFPQPDRVVVGEHESLLPIMLVKSTAREFGAKVQDLLLAAMVEAFARLHLTNSPDKRPPKFSFYTPVDLRGESGIEVPEVLGQLLGGMTIRQRTSRRMRFSQLVGAVSSQTRALKVSGQYRSYALTLETMARMWDVLPRSINRVLGPSLSPVTGLSSNVNLSDFFAEELACGLLKNYQRYTGTGIMTSMMLGLTTLGEHFNLTSTHHASLYSEREIAYIRQHIAERLLGRPLPNSASILTYSRLATQETAVSQP